MFHVYTGRYTHIYIYTQTYTQVYQLGRETEMFFVPRSLCSQRNFNVCLLFSLSMPQDLLFKPPLLR